MVRLLPSSHLLLSIPILATSFLKTSLYGYQKKKTRKEMRKSEKNREENIAEKKNRQHNIKDEYRKKENRRKE